MALTISKKPKEKKTEVQAVELNDVDRWNELKAQIAKIADKTKPLAKELKEIEARLQAQADEKAEKDETGQIEGETGYIEFGEKGKSREVTDKAKILEILGPETFVELSAIKLGDIDNYLTLEQRKEVLEEKQEGNRSFKFIPKNKK